MNIVNAMLTGLLVVCPMTVEPSTAADFTSAFQEKNDMTWSGGDGVTSLKLPNGHVYWTFGDTIHSSGEAPNGAYPLGSLMVANTILMQQPGGSFVNAMENGDSPAVANPSSTDRYWTLGMFYANGHLYVLCQRLRNVSTGLGFELAGVDIAKFSANATTGLLTLVKMVQTPSATVTTDGRGPAYVQWSLDAYVTPRSRLALPQNVIIYGSALEDNIYAPNATYVAKTTTQLIEDPTSWKFWKPSTQTWETDKMLAEPIILSQVTSVRNIGGKFVLLHKPWNIWGTEIYAEISDSPVGPFVSKKILDSPSGLNYDTYSPQAHPEQQLSSGKILVSVSWNGKTFNDLLGDADLYKPRFYEVTLP